MEKRSITVLQSPEQLFQNETNKKIKISLTPKKEPIENNGNLMNLLDPGFDINDLCFDEDDDLWKSDAKNEEPLDLSDFKRCLVKLIEIHQKAFEKVLHLQEKKTLRTAKCIIKGIWYDTEISQGDVCSLKGIWNEERKLFLISNQGGIIVILPDHLVSGTTVVGSLFCARKCILTEKFRGVDSADSLIMNVGNIVHEILQKVMKRNLTTINEIKKVTDDVLNKFEIVQLLYSCKISFDELKKEIDPFIARIYEFMQNYFVGIKNSQDDNPNSSNKSFVGRIADVVDIEENIWSPRLGLKGKIDATVTVHPPNNFFNEFRKIMPLEIKTGKASFSLEHKGQLILYQMMFQDIGKELDSGLLLYIRDGIMSEVRPTNPEKFGLLTLRNRLVKYLSMDIVTREKSINLPEPINHSFACSKCPYNVLCCAFLKKDSDYQLKPDHPLVKIQNKKISHLTDEHLNYFLHWCHLITLEHNESQKSIKIRHIWTKTPEERARKGNCIANLKIKDLVHPQHDEFIHQFDLQESDKFSESNKALLEIGDYLIVSTNKRCSVTAGRVVSLEPSHITMSLSKDLSRSFSTEKFHLDKYESQSQNVFNLTNIGILLESHDDKGTDRLRGIIIDKVPASFSNSLPKSIQQTMRNVFANMNSVQQTAILKALTCDNYMLIKGLPGTGKTQTLVYLIHLLTSMKKSILITSHTNSAVDNILLRLKDRGIKFLRLGSITRINSSLREFSESILLEKCKNVDDLEKLYNQYQIIAVTCLGAAHSLLTRRRFDYCLVDEATQIFQPTVIRPLLFSDRFILVGDPDQLAPLVRSNDARLLGANESLFERLDSEKAAFTLGLQYRMNRTITKLANSLTYKGFLKCANENIEKAVMQIPLMDKLKQKFIKDKWLAKILSSHIDQACALINTGDVYEMATKFLQSLNSSEKTEDKTSKLYINYCEIAVVMYIVDLLMECGVTGESIGIIAPYRDQVEALKKVFQSYHSVEVNTVDQYQGRDKKIIIYSCTISETFSNSVKTSSEVEILEDRRRLTVAITRAKHKLIMIGDVNCLNKYTPFRDLFKCMNSISKVNIENNKFGFSWNDLLELLKVKLTY